MLALDASGNLGGLELLSHVRPVKGVTQGAICFVKTKMPQYVVSEAEKHFANVTHTRDDKPVPYIPQLVSELYPWHPVLCLKEHVLYPLIIRVSTTDLL